MKEVEILFRRPTFKCRVSPGRYTANPNSGLYQSGDVPDERVPEGIIVYHSSDNSTHCLPWRYESKISPGSTITTRVSIDEEDFSIAKDPEGEDCSWDTSWRRIECQSLGHAQFVLTLLKEGLLGQAMLSATVIPIKGTLAS